MNNEKPTATTQKFELGNVVGTPPALRAIREAGQTPTEFIHRHAAGDWGEVCPEDALLNDEALVDQSRLLSAYTLRTGVKIWVITEAVGEDGRRSATTVLLPEDY
jgi:hypothetical protein